MPPPSSVSTQSDGSDYEIDSEYSAMDTEMSSASSTRSVFPFDPNSNSELYRELHGRLFNSRNSLYNLPADEIEFSRLDKQHLMHQTVLGSLYQEPDTVRRILAPEPGVNKSILDCGTGGGNWLDCNGYSNGRVRRIQEFPHAQVVGVDLAPSTLLAPPPNCRFEFDDVMLGMPHYHGCFDVVHGRSCAGGIKDFPAFIEEMRKCLKPGGILLVVEGDLQLYSPTYDPIDAAFETGKPGSWLARLLFETYSALKARGSQVDAGRFLVPWLQTNKGLEHTKQLDVYTPVGPWRSGRNEHETTALMFVGELMRQNALEFVRALKPVVIEEGYPEETLDRWIQGIDDELTSLSVHMYTKWYYGCAIKRPDAALDG